MPAILIRNLSEETRQALRARARRHGRSTEAEIRAILDGAARPGARLRLGTELAKLAQPLGGLELDLERDQTPAGQVRFR